METARCAFAASAKATNDSISPLVLLLQNPPHRAKMCAVSIGYVSQLLLQIMIENYKNKPSNFKLKLLYL